MLPSRFNRDYQLTVSTGSGQGVVVGPPMRVVFSTNKSIEGGLNTASIRVYNLQQSTRLAVVKDADEQKHIPVSLSVGYDGTLHTVFKGSVFRGENMREGPDLITELESKDGWFDHRNSFTAKTVRGKDAALAAILADMPNTGRGKLSALSAVTRPKVLVGKSTKLISDLMDEGQTWYIEDEKLYVLQDGEVTSNFIPVVSAETGMLNTPTREQSLVTFETLLNPTLKIGALCRLLSVTAQHMNGTYKIFSIAHTGDSYGRNWKQTVVCRAVNDYEVI